MGRYPAARRNKEDFFSLKPLLNNLVESGLGPGTTDTMELKNTIAIVDDDQELSELIGRFLRENGFDVIHVYDGNSAIEVIGRDKPDLVILDLMLPGIDGLTVCKQIRSTYFGPIIMLTALNDEIDEVTGLEVGADDYLAKPIKPRVLLAHVRAQLRRQNLSQALNDTATVAFGNDEFSVSLSSRELTQNGTTIMLTSAEFDLLWLLAESVGKVLTREELHKTIFGLPYDGTDRSLDLRISRIRRKLGDSSKDPKIIKTVRNVGYLLVQRK